MRFLLYGAYGYTGALTAREAAARGWRPILAGRDGRRLAALGHALGLDTVRFDLADTRTLEAVLRDSGAVLNCAGPFSHTAAHVAAACVRVGAHYLDITGEVAAMLAVHALDARAREAGVTLLPGVGFDVVPTDCLAAHLARRLPGAKSLALAFGGTAGVSRGTALSMAEAAPRGGLVRVGGALARVPAAWRTRRLDMGRGGETVVSLPWGDVFTAGISTTIPEVIVYTGGPAPLRWLLYATRYVGWALGSRPAQALAKGVIRSVTRGPSARQRREARSYVWGEVRDGEGRVAVSRMVAPEAYSLTVQTALESTRRVLAGEAPPGFQTPSLAFGPDFILGFEGITRSDQ